MEDLALNIRAKILMERECRKTQFQVSFERLILITERKSQYKQMLNIHKINKKVAASNSSYSF